LIDAMVDAAYEALTQVDDEGESEAGEECSDS